MAVDSRLFPALQAEGDAPEPRPGRWSYLDTAATALMPQPVLDAVAEALARGGTAGRSVHRLGREATASYERARLAVARHLGAAAEELVFVRSATEGLNLVAEGWARPRLGPGDEVCVSVAEHHSNLLPWRRVCEQRGARLVLVECDDDGDLDLAALRRRLSRRTKLLALTHVSNVTGAETSIPEVARILAASAAADAALVVDGAQAIPHLDVDVTELGCDFYAFSGHKAYGPPGVGAVWARPRRWQETQPLLVGGGMVLQVSDERVDLLDGPARFEAGTPHVAAAIGLAAALRFLTEHRDHGHERALLRATEEALRGVPGVRVLGNPRRRCGLISFAVDGVHAHDVGSLLDEHGVAVRAGHHCAQPLLRHLGVMSAVRVSLGLYNDEQDVERLVAALGLVHDALSRRCV